MSFEEAKAQRDLIQQEVDRAGEALEAFPRTGPMNLTPDAVRATPAWQTAKANYQRAFKRLQDFNVTFTKTFAKELRAERARRGR